MQRGYAITRMFFIIHTFIINHLIVLTEVVAAGLLSALILNVLPSSVPQHIISLKSPVQCSPTMVDKYQEKSY